MLPDSNEAQLEDRRRRKFTAFIISEGTALAVLIASLLFGILGRFSDPTLVLSMNVITYASAAAVALIPILFYAIASTIPTSGK